MGHEPAIKAGDKIIQEMSKRTGRPEISIFRDMQREYFMGGTSARRSMARTMGNNVMRQLAKIPSQDANQVEIT
jgi:hypothetical protein